MICDDDQGIADLLVMVLEDAGFQAVSEINSLNVYWMIEQEQPDLLLLDLWMPILSGDQVLRSLKCSPKTSRLPVIILSVSLGGKNIAAASGANDFLAKPFDLNLLIAKVNQLVK